MTSLSVYVYTMTKKMTYRKAPAHASDLEGRAEEARREPFVKMDPVEYIVSVRKAKGIVDPEETSS